MRHTKIKISWFLFPWLLQRLKSELVRELFITPLFMHHFLPYFVILLHTKLNHKTDVTKLPSCISVSQSKIKPTGRKKPIIQLSQQHINLCTPQKAHMRYSEIKFCTYNTMVFSCNLWHVLVIPAECFGTCRTFPNATFKRIFKSFFIFTEAFFHFGFLLLFSVDIKQLISVYLNKCPEFYFPA